MYAISRALHWREPATLRTALAAWRPERRRVTFGLLLALAGTGWVLTSAALITGFAPAPVASPADFVRVVVLNPHGVLFETWLALGGLLAAPVFASSVVALPLLLDRPVSVLGAVLTSWRVVQSHPLPLALWAVPLPSSSKQGKTGARHFHRPLYLSPKATMTTNSRPFTDDSGVGVAYRSCIVGRLARFSFFVAPTIQISSLRPAHPYADRSEASTSVRR